MTHGPSRRAAPESLCTEPTFEHFVCLYIAEGSKRSRNVVAICNSDPAVVAIGNRWVQRFARNPVTFSMQYHADQDLDELRRYWSGIVGAGPDEIRLQRKSNSNQLTGRTWRSVYGVLEVRACDTLLRSRLQAWMDLIRKQWSVPGQSV